MASDLGPAALRERLADVDFDFEVAAAADGTLRLAVAAEASAALLRRLREEPELAMERLVDLTAVDRGGTRGRFEVVYLLASQSSGARLRIHVALDDPGAEELPSVDSVCSLWPAADWLEREVFDLFGIGFRGHPGLRRLLLEPDFEGAPLRKDHPLRTTRPLPEKVAP